MLHQKCQSLICFLTICFGIFVNSNVIAAQPQPSWDEWLAGVRVEAVAQGIRPELFEEVFKDIRQPSRNVLSYDRNQPEKRLTFLTYRDTRFDAYRITMGRRALAKHRALLNEIGSKYGVNPCFIVSFWGLETSYGNFMGKFPVMQSLATLAYNPRRGPFFRKQLLYALHILNDGHVKNEDFRGEWAGASGHPQFLPSSWYAYAVDYDGDGRKDIWKTLPDVFASIANYLVENGWQRDQPWAIAVNVPAGLQDTVNQQQYRTLEAWRANGVTTVNEQPWPKVMDLPARLIHPYGGPDFLVFNNFNVIMKWNRSTYYAGTVGYGAEKICGRPLYH